MPSAEIRRGRAGARGGALRARGRRCPLRRPAAAGCARHVLTRMLGPVVAQAPARQAAAAGDEKPVTGPGAARFAGAVTAVVVASWLPGVLGATTRAAVRWIVAPPPAGLYPLVAPPRGRTVAVPRRRPA